LARRRQAQTPAQHRLVLDAGAVIALGRNDPRARAALIAAGEIGAQVSIPAVVVAETVRSSGPRDASVNRVLRSVGDITPSDEAGARLAGRLLGIAGSNSTVDALIVAAAVEHGGAVILTGDPDDLGRLAQPHPEVLIQAL
jgi:predicted nucleic acid-binding protein